MQRCRLDRAPGSALPPVRQNEGTPSVLNILSIAVASSIVELLLEIDAIRLRLGTHEVEVGVLLGHLGGRICHELPLLLAVGEPQRSILVLEDVALLEHGVNLSLHVAHLLQVCLSSSCLLLHLLKPPHLLSDLCLLLRSPKLLLLDLSPRLPPLCSWFHEVA